MLIAVVALVVPQVQALQVDHDDVVIRESCRVRITSESIPDTNGNGVIQIVGDDIVVEFDSNSLPLNGGLPRQAGLRPDQWQGIGIHVTGHNITLRQCRIQGFKVGILARRANELTIEDSDVSDNFRQRLKSTVSAEDGGDWLWPHVNDDGEWRKQYGAGIYVERSAGVTVRRCRARRVQNGLILDRVAHAKIYDNDFSFLSGWGIAMWRSSHNLISRNALDFCIRGYSHGVYNRGQDSAGLLMFEQCSDNIIVENSATHGGDGFFGFAGKEALGEHPAPAEDFDYRQRGNNENLLLRNDFSYAAAHGIEMTFSFGNRFLDNRLVGNAICGIWGGYSQDTLIRGNQIEDNGDRGYGLERGGVNIEHSKRNHIIGNRFRNNRCGVHIWWDEDAGLSKLPWALANGTEVKDNAIVANHFEGDELAIQLRDFDDGVVLAGNQTEGVARVLDSPPEASSQSQEPHAGEAFGTAPQVEVLGETRPVGARAELRGRENIIMTEWGPYDWEAPHLHFVGEVDGEHHYRVLGDTTVVGFSLDREGARAVMQPSQPPVIRIRPERSGAVLPYRLSVQTPTEALEATGTLIATDWDLSVWAWQTDPREDADQWRSEGRKLRFRVSKLDLRFAMKGPSELEQASPELRSERLPTDRFATIAETTLSLPAGRWRLKTLSDDGIRVHLDDRLVIDDWTWHAPKPNDYEFELEQAKRCEVRVEHFELDGYAVLSLEFERLEH